MNLEEQKQIKLLQKGDITTFESIFRNYYPNLCHFAHQYVSDKTIAESLVQDTFVRIWENKAQITIERSIRNYLLQMVKNRCLNYLEHISVQKKYIEKQILEGKTKQEPKFFEIGLRDKIQRSIDALPAQRQQIFRLCKQDGLSYKQVAQKLNISVKTVENHMGLALKQLREALKEYKNHFLLFSLFND